MLTVAVERHHDRRAAGPGRVDTGADRGGFAQTPGVTAHVGTGPSGDLGALVARAIVDDQHRGVAEGAPHDLADGVGLVEDRYDDERVHARARSVVSLGLDRSRLEPGPATTIATWLPPRATA